MGETTLEKNKDYIEFKIHSMMITHKPYDGIAEIGITGTIPERDFLAANNPFDSPCDVIMVSKRNFERLQAANEQLKKKLEEANSMLETDKYLKKLYSIDDVENFKWCLNHTCGGRDSANGWIAISLFWKRKYEALSKIVGFSSDEEIQEYLTYEAKCETLHEAIVKLIDSNKRVCEEWCSANSSNNSWKATAECNSPKELMTKLNSLRDDIKEYKEKYDQAIEIIGKWQRATGQLLPNVDDNELAAWKKATGCSTPEEANKKLASYEGRLDSVKQSASIAIRHLDNIVFRDDKRSDWSDK